MTNIVIILPDASLNRWQGDTQQNKLKANSPKTLDCRTIPILSAVWLQTQGQTKKKKSVAQLCS